MKLLALFAAALLAGGVVVAQEAPPPPVEARLATGSRLVDPGRTNSSGR